MAVKVALDVSAVPKRVAGAGRYIVELARRLPLRDHDVTLVTRRDDAERWRAVSSTSSIAALVPSRRAERLLYEAWRLGRSDVARDVDVWHSPHYTMPRRCAAPTVVTIHDMTMFTNPEWHERSKVAFFRRAISHSATHADVLICVSDFTARQLDAIIPRHAPVVVAPLGVDAEAFSLDASGDEDLFLRHGLPLDVPYIFFLGTVEPRKGLDVLLEAFAQLTRDDTVTELWIAGQAGWAMKQFADELARNRDAPRIRRLGFVDEALVAPLLRRARVVAYPSRGEGFGLPVLEALSCGAVVVTTSDTVMAEIGADAVLLAPPGDADALAHQLAAALGLDGAQRARHALVARERAKTFTWDAMVSRHLTAYESAKG
jgi:glycosyltransferase involved in cell wall biosynthesis